jgi:Flp pilus assembly protein TadG
MTPFHKRLGSRRGNAMIEFAFSASVLIPLFLGTFQFGYAFYVYNLLCTQMRAGARYASMKTFKASASSTFKQQTRNVIRFGNPDGTGTLIEPRLTDAQLDVQIKDSSGNNADASHVPNYVTVSTSNYSLNAVVTTFNFSGKPMARFPYAGRYAPAE